MAHQTENLAKLKKGNELYLSAKSNPGDVSPEVRRRFPPYATVPKPSFYRRATVAPK